MCVRPFSAALANFACIIALLFWRPHPDDFWVFFTFPALWGMADAIWQTQTNCKKLRSHSFSPEDEPFSFVSLDICVTLASPLVKQNPSYAVCSSLFNFPYSHIIHASVAVLSELILLLSVPQLFTASSSPGRKRPHSPTTVCGSHSVLLLPSPTAPSYVWSINCTSCWQFWCWPPSLTP